MRGEAVTRPFDKHNSLEAELSFVSPPIPPQGCPSVGLHAAVSNWGPQVVSHPRRVGEPVGGIRYSLVPSADSGHGQKRSGGSICSLQIV